VKRSGKILYSVFLVILIVCFHCSNNETKHKVLVLGVDGMDPVILGELIREGKLPHFERLIREGSFSELGTSNPPQSPVAWSNFITGKNPGGHGIFDFIHRDPENFIPYLSTSKVEPPGRSIKLGKWRIPLASGSIELLRRGKAFWEILEENGIQTTIYKIPANFPPEPESSRSISGMGTPDILGTSGLYSFYTNEYLPEYEKVSGGKVFEIDCRNNHFSAHLPGPSNPFRENNPEVTISFDVHIDPVNEAVKIELPEDSFILTVGEWSEWIKVKYSMLPYINSVSGIVKFYLKEVKPSFKLYASPINIDPSDPALPISNPEDYSRELFRKFGYFYTQEMAEDTKAYLENILSLEEYIKQAFMVYEEQEKMYFYELNRFTKGLLFFYFSSTDMNAHVLWHLRDENHPYYNKKTSEKTGNIIEFYYRKIDDILKKTLDKIDEETTLIIMSDHGFAPVYKQINLNTWLLNEGYIKLFRNWEPEDDYFQAVDWRNTKAYALGLNGLYINLEGREYMGIVGEGDEKETLLDEIIEKLEAVADPETGEKIIKNVYKSSEIYSGKYKAGAPDLIVGCARGYRISNTSALGNFSDNVIESNDWWSGDHCIDPDEVPGIVVSNKKIKVSKPKLYDITATILKEFKIEIPEEVIGKPVF